MNDFDPSSGSVAATDNKRTPEQKQLMLNNILTGVQIAQNAKMNGALQDLKRETQVQTQHLARLEQTQSVMLDEQKKTNALLEGQKIERDLDKAAKNVVFNFKNEKNHIANLPTNLERYVNASSCLKNFEDTGVDYESLPDISDKEFLYNSMKDLENICTDSASDLSDEEIDDLSKLNKLKNDIASLTEIKSQIQEKKKETDRKVKRWKEKTVDELVSENDILPEKKIGFITYGKAVLALLIGIGGAFVGAALSGDAKDVLIGTSLILVLVGALMFVWRLVVLGMLGGVKASVKKNSRNTKEAAEEVRARLIDEAEKNFDKFVEKAAQKTETVFEVKKWSDFFARELKLLEDEYKDILAKYPSINIVFKEIAPGSSSKGSSGSVNESSSKPSNDDNLDQSDSVSFSEDNYFGHNADLVKLVNELCFGEPMPSFSEYFEKEYKHPKFGSVMHNFYADASVGIFGNDYLGDYKDLPRGDDSLSDEDLALAVLDLFFKAIGKNSRTGETFREYYKIWV